MNPRLPRTALAVLLTTCGSLGCAGTVEVTRTFTPQAAAQAQNEKVAPTAVVRGDERIALPAGARVEAGRVAVPRERPYVHKLGPGEVVEQDAQGRIVAVRSHVGVVASFVPGTAESPEGSDEVRGRLTGDSIALRPGDGIEMRGELSPDDSVPGGGRVESTRATGTLVAGVVLLALSYAPSAYVGAKSPLETDRALEIPVAGPWIDLSRRPACVPPQTATPLPIDPCIEDRAARVAIVTSGVAQGLGALLTVVGLPAQAKIVDGGDRGVSFSLVPTPGGAAAVGAF